MDFLGRVEAATADLARKWDAPTDIREMFRWSVGSIPRTREAYRLLFGLYINPGDHLEPWAGASPNVLLWTHWCYVLQREEGAKHLLPRIWDRAFAKQSSAGHLHPLTPDTLLDAFVYDELTALHAAYRSALALRDPQKLAQCRRIVEYHVANTQPDHTTAEPWALAAFAALDDTGTFAEQQLHDATAAVSFYNPVILALLADAALAMRQARELR